MTLRRGTNSAQTWDEQRSDVGRTAFKRGTNSVQIWDERCSNIEQAAAGCVLN
ncbi:hypothetical protein [Bacteroides finegoldii]|uniref:hypothetical protein n=1 Tax=Bacteroides finegoldii TaxID=338188 RepID=UPI00189B7F90|nr:hypothetical protein [Bacteroides finegoldii]